MTDEPTSTRALIAAYKACARPSAAGEAQLWATLAAAERAASARARRPAWSSAPWLALAAGLLLLAAWQLDLARIFASGHVLKDMRDQAAYAAPETSPQVARSRDEAIGATAEPPRLEVVVTPPRERPRGEGRGAVREQQGRAGAADGAGAGDASVLAEMALLQEARAALRGGRPDAALELLGRHAESFARGSMAEERAALRVLALCAAGELVDGTAEAAAFLRAHPRSAYAPRVAAACAKEQDLEDTSKMD
ncbi:hypothetical protein [Nannocystis pusilla]|uniref:Outer membrane lipoprotein BamD-like domain-containing protein n=1 Tax=Nannocystis pusilla TaxID=889268 RepID=A0ABS7U338_9BACT|nr:hypothetical protein [Nannocystis pusilla]MBZ5714937.1 hypothetical protein [Nannocystis pusilla]